MIGALLASVLVTCILVELIYRAVRHPKLKPALASVQNGFSQFRKATTDDERQQLLLSVGSKTLLLSTAFLGACILLFVIAFAPMHFFAWDHANEIVYLGSLTVLSIVWFYIRAKSFPRKGAGVQSAGTRDGSYGFLDRCLHHMALGSTTLRRVAFDMEKLVELPENVGAKDSPVYVCGLARSGTTMLLRILDQSAVFRSLSYRDMPFVMAPNLWKRISRYGEREASLAERAHGDGVYVGFDSPEAFEEVFWQTFDQPIDSATCYGMPAPSEETLNAFADYRRLVANPKSERRSSGIEHRYLSKNNNNLIRLPSLCAEASASVLLVYRDPVATARSLYTQHQRFLVAQREDSFTLKYMKWLGHHEFGLGHKPFCFAASAMNPTLTPDRPDYWLDYWNAVHRYILTHDERTIHLVHHDTMCVEPQAFLARLFALLDVNMDVPVLAQEIRSPKQASANPDEFSPAFVGAAYQTYRLLLEKSSNLLVSLHRAQPS
ncbi:MAG TPA: sulfotransferase [Burkholderiales bacterium]|nr:sulfotransferase [Burkholderiales bacterium]